MEERSERPPALLSAGVIACSGATRGDQLLSIDRQLRQVLLRWRPAWAWLEKPGSWMRHEGTSRQSVEAMAQARGVMLAACAELAVPAREIDFHVVRQTLIGRRNAGADAVLGLVRDRGFNPPTRPRGGADLDVANAIMVALYGLLVRGNR